MKLSLAFLLFLFLAAPTVAVSENRDQVIFNDTVVIPAGNYWAAPIEADSSGRVRGWWRVAKYDAIVYILDSANFNAFKQNADFFVVYQSGKLTGGVLDVKLPRGLYWLVISNRHALWYSKTVTGFIKFEN